MVHDGTRYIVYHLASYSYNGKLIEYRIWSIEQRHFQCYAPPRMEGGITRCFRSSIRLLRT